LIVEPGTNKPLGIDEDGEVWVRGPQVMAGYLNNEAATADTIPVTPGIWRMYSSLTGSDSPYHRNVIFMHGTPARPPEARNALRKAWQAPRRQRRNPPFYGTA
jgi:acyl-CoA synthetase (AMP-forming)/AMP-acid ligase II